MRSALIGLLMALGVASTTQAAVSVSIGINIPVYPHLVAVPGYPVYYAPSVNANYFFYDGLYWVFDGEQWLSSSWYNGPWVGVAHEHVPLYLWQVPVRYYHRPPVYFKSWGRDAAPHWGEHWGPEWGARHVGWDHYDKRTHYTPAPLPTYQKAYTGTRYPTAEKQWQIHEQNYRYQPHEQVIREHYDQRGAHAPGAHESQGREQR